MRKIQRAILVLLLVGAASPLTAQRYLSDVFTNVSVTQNVRYGNNWTALLKYTGTSPYIFVPDSSLPASLFGQLVADIYEPVGDTMMHRPTIIFGHAGSMFPIFQNTLMTGDKTDSSITNICKEFARRGYTAIAYDYRLGWCPFSSSQDTRTGTELQGIGRAIQDAKACVRFFRNNAMTTNTWHIDPNKIILGGDGVGGDVAVAYMSANQQNIQLTKFISSVTDTFYHFTAGYSYFDSTYWGNLDGYGGSPYYNNSNNTPGVNSAVQFEFALEPVIGDSSWMKAGDPPMVVFHVPSDSSNPYYCGGVSIHCCGHITDVCGTHTIIYQADDVFHNNSSFQNNTWSDPYTLQARAVDGTSPNLDGLYQFLNQTGGATWDFTDSTTCFYYMINVMGFTTGKADTAWYNWLSVNMGQNSTTTRHYIDTIMGYLNPRIVAALGLVGIDELSVLEKSVSVYPNPSSGQFTVSVASNEPVLAIELNDITGRLIRNLEKPTGRSFLFSRNHLDAGVYFIKLKFDKGDVVKKIILQ